MFWRYAFFAASALPTIASAQVLQTTGGDVNIIAQARAHTEEETHNNSGFFGGSSVEMSLTAFKEYSDPTQGYCYARGTAGLFWRQTDNGTVSELTGGAGGIAEAYTEGLDTLALGAASISVYFEVLTDSIAEIDSQGTYNTDLYAWDGNGWAAFYTGFTGTETINISAGRYKWDAAAGEMVTGYSYYSSGVNFRITAQAVPEPGSVAAVGLGALFLIRRRKRCLRLSKGRYAP